MNSFYHNTFLGFYKFNQIFNCVLFFFFHINPESEEEEEEEEEHPIYLNENHPTSSNLPSSPSLEGFGYWIFCLATLKNGKIIEVGFCMRRFLDDADDDEQHDDDDDGEL